MRDKIFWKDEFEWENPIKEQTIVPYLADEIFPVDPSSADYARSVQVLREFYCDAREDMPSDVGKLNAYIAAPNQQVFIIEGEAGIGKTWFIRYNLALRAHLGTDGDHSRRPSLYAGVIDLLRAAPGDAEASIFQQICPIIEHCLGLAFGDLRSAFIAYAEHRSSHISTGAASTVRDTTGQMRQWVDRWISIGHDPDKRKEYAQELLRIIECLSVPTLFLVIDNVDRLPQADQKLIVELVRRVLRHHRIRLIIPLRETSTWLRNRFDGLSEVSCDDMRLSKLRIGAAIAPRFHKMKNLQTLADHVINDGRLRKSTTYPKLYRKVFGSRGQGEVGALLERLACGNCRFALWLMNKLLMSRQLKGLQNIGNLQYAIASWMFSDGSDPYDALIINLFDPGDGPLHGRSLVRYRLLEYFYREGHVGLEEDAFNRHFGRLGYDAQLVRASVVRMMMAAMIVSDSGFTPKEVASHECEVGTLVLTETGKCYWEVLLHQQWYYIATMRQLAPKLEQRFLKQESDSKKWYITHRSFIDFLKEEEDEEKARAKQWHARHGEIRGLSLEMPSLIAEQSLRRREGSDDAQ